VFTPCDVCTANGSPITPSWSIQASKVIQDHDHHLVFYRNAVISIKGVPVLYAPVFWTPDPESNRLSGLLMPRISSTSSRGLSYEQPYLQVISPSQELVVSPQINTDQNPFLNLKWLERFYSGELTARIGYTYSQDFDSKGGRFGPETSRSYILSDGHFDINSAWSWGFTLDRASDPLIFEKYDIPSVFSDRGLYFTDTQRLLSQIFATRQDSNSYLSIAALDFQGLRTIPGGATENSATFPSVAPLIEARYEPAAEILGGRLRFLGSAVVETTPDSTINPSQPGLDDRRATAEADWQSTYTLSNGLRLSPFLDARTDVYNIQNLSPTNTADRTLERGLGTAGLNVSWPFVKQDGDTTIVLEPLAQLDLSPNVTLNPNIPNTDSVATAFDETNLFSMDRFSGFDLYEGGQRLNLGGRVTVDWGDGYSGRLLVGRTLRAQSDQGFSPKTGLNGQASDWVIAADTTPINGLSLFGRTLLDDGLQSQLTEVGVDYANSRSRGYVRYDDDNTQVTGRTRDIEGAEDFFFTKHWGVSLVGVRDIELNNWRKSDIGLIYKDDCIRVEVVYQQEDTVVGRLGKSDAVLFNLKIATLGDEGYTDADSR
jgi:LPS-assembly protein